MSFSIFGSVVLALGLGGALGLEREIADKPAGLRTNMLVAAAAAFVVCLSDLLVERFQSELESTVVAADPIRVVQAVVIGVSFIGTGTIIRRQSKSEVEGLTTAATLLMSAVIGIGVALSAKWLAVSVTIVVLVTLRGVALIEGWLAKYRLP